METLSAAQTEVPGRRRMDSWPALPDDENENAEQSSNSNLQQNPTSNQQPTDDDWDFIDDPDDDEALAEAKMKARVQFDPKILYRCASTPDFGNYDGEPSAHQAAVDADLEDASANANPSQDASASEESENTTAEQPPASNPAAPPAAAAAPPSTSAWGGGGRRPSFRDMILLNADKTAAEAEAAERHRAETAALLKKEREEHRRARLGGLRSRLVVEATAPIRRCAKSTGNLRALDHIQEHHDEEEEEEDCYGGGGGGGGGGGFGGGPISENDHGVLGDTDAADFYHRKNKGAQNRVAGEKIRPDELKRKEISQYKRDAQRRAQQERQGGGDGGAKSKQEQQPQQHKLGGKALNKAERQAAAAKGGKKGRQKK